MEPPSDLRVTRRRGPLRTSAETAILSDGVFEITISSDSLLRIDMKVFEAGVLLKELSRSHLFLPGGSSQVTYQLDAVASTLVAVFVPKGRPGTSADVFIERL